MEQIELLYSNHNISNPVMALHNESIKFQNLVLLQRGTLRYEIDGTEILLTPGDALFVAQGSRRIRDKSAEDIEHFVFNFQCEQPVPLPTVMRNVISGEIFSVLGAYDAINKTSRHEHRAKNELLLQCLLLILQERAVSQKQHPLTRTILAHIHSHFSEKITLQQIGELTFFSPIYCDTVFKNDTGVSIIEYLLSLRIENAKQLLSEEELTVKEIAESVGFQDHNYFSRVFKKRVGLSPTEYRQKL